MESANSFLEDEYLDALNEQFHVVARSAGNLHRSIPREITLNHVLCFQESRVVQNDWTISWCNRIFQLSAEHQKLSLARRKILVSELLDGTIRLTFGSRVLSWKEVSKRPSRTKKEPKQAASRKGPHKPAVNHPWRRPR